MKIYLLAIMFLSLVEGSTASENLPELKVVSKVDLSQYLGKWYEIARYPNSFQKDCDQATAQYTLQDDGDIKVLNTCVRKKEKTLDLAYGLARIVDIKVSSAKLTVTFLPTWLRWTGIGLGKYWIIDLGPKYEYAVVSEPSRKYLWILSRTPTIKQGLYNKILGRLREQHLDPAKLIKSRDE